MPRPHTPRAQGLLTACVWLPAPWLWGSHCGDTVSFFACSCEEKGLVVKVKGTNTSDVICGKCSIPCLVQTWCGLELHAAH